jgi:hypothetical protein
LIERCNVFDVDFEVKFMTQTSSRPHSQDSNPEPFSSVSDLPTEESWLLGDEEDALFSELDPTDITAGNPAGNPAGNGEIDFTAAPSANFALLPDEPTVESPPFSPDPWLSAEDPTLPSGDTKPGFRVSTEEKQPAAINAIAPDFACILAVTHMPQFKEAFQHRIEVSKNAQGSYLHLMG